MSDERFRRDVEASQEDGSPFRPLSPHLGVYRLPATAWLSITHRATGVLLTLGLLVWAFGLMAAAAGPAAYEAFHAFLGSVPGIVLLWGWLWALFFHLCHGIRHLVWDMGRGFASGPAIVPAVLEVGFSVLLTLGTFVYGAGP